LGVERRCRVMTGSDIYTKKRRKWRQTWQRKARTQDQRQTGRRVFPKPPTILRSAADAENEAGNAEMGCQIAIRGGITGQFHSHCPFRSPSNPCHTGPRALWAAARYNIEYQKHTYRAPSKGTPGQGLVSAVPWQTGYSVAAFSCPSYLTWRFLLGAWRCPVHTRSISLFWGSG